MFKLIITLLKLVEKRKTNSRTRNQSVKQEEISWSISISLEKIMFNQLIFLFLLCNSFSSCNFNFDLEIHFLNISVYEFEKKKRKLFENNEEKRKLINDYFSATKLIVFLCQKVSLEFDGNCFFSPINMLE
jgi:hypothetical protein